MPPLDYNIAWADATLNSTDYIALDLYVDNYEYNKLYTVAQVSKRTRPSASGTRN